MAEYPPIPEGKKLPFVDQVTNRLNDPTMAAIADSPELSATFAGFEQPNTFTEKQQFDATQGFGVGDDLKLTFVDGFFGQRLHLTGTEEGVMPYYEVAPTSTVSTDVGKRLAGMQVYKTPGGGGVPDREFLAIESIADDGSMPGFTIQTWASGTGVVRPLRIVIGAVEQMRFYESGVQFKAPITADTEFSNDAKITSIKAAASPFIAVRGTNQTEVIQARVYSNSASNYPRMFFGKNRGTDTVPTAPASADPLGVIQFGAMNGATELDTAAIIANANEAWTLGSAQGTRLVFSVTANGATARAEVFRLRAAAADTETSVQLAVNRSGVVTTSNQVTVGAVDSGGTGFRVLRVPN